MATIDQLTQTQREKILKQVFTDTMEEAARVRDYPIDFLITDMRRAFACFDATEDDPAARYAALIKLNAAASALVCELLATKTAEPPQDEAYVAPAEETR